MTAATVYRAVVGCVPDADLSPNARVNWRVRARKVRALREFVYYQAREDAPRAPIAGPVVVTVTIGWPKRRPGMDLDNCIACTKGAIDGLVDAGFLRDDKQITELRVRQRKWSEWREQGGWRYEHGCMTFDFEEVQA